MTIVEKAAYLKGLTEGLGVEPDSRDGKLWGALTELLSDMAHEIEDLHSSHEDLSDVLDEVCEDLAYVEELVGDLDTAPFDDDDFWDDDEDPDGEERDNLFRFPGLVDDDEDEGDGEEPEYDGVVYDVTCPNCGEEISFDEDTLETGSIKCPGCGEVLQFDLGEDR